MGKEFQILIVDLKIFENDSYAMTGVRQKISLVHLTGNTAVEFPSSWFFIVYFIKLCC